MMNQLHPPSFQLFSFSNEDELLPISASKSGNGLIRILMSHHKKDERKTMMKGWMGGGLFLLSHYSWLFLSSTQLLSDPRCDPLFIHSFICHHLVPEQGCRGWSLSQLTLGEGRVQPEHVASSLQGRHMETDTLRPINLDGGRKYPKGTHKNTGRTPHTGPA